MNQPARHHGAAAWSAWRPALAWALGGYLVLRVLSELTALVSVYGVQFPHVVRANPSVLISVWRHWDAGIFSTIADNGYVNTSAGATAFGPVLPYSMRAVARVLHVNTLTAGMLITNTCLIAALAVLFRYVEESHGRRGAATTVTVLLLWPTSFFLVTPYAEPLVLLFGVAAFMQARHGRWGLAGLSAAVAVMSKPLMALALLGLLWDCIVERRHLARRQLARDTALLLLPTVVALGAWTLYLHHLVGDAFAFVHAQQFYGRSLAGPWSLLSRTAGDLVHLRFLDTPQASAMEPFDVLTVLLVIAAAVYWWRARVRAYSVFLAAEAIVFLSGGILMAETREMLALFPVFIAGAMLVTRRPSLERVYSPAGAVTGVWLVIRFVHQMFAG